MTVYAYRAMNGQGRIVSGRVDALNLVDLETRLKRLGLDFINGQPARRPAGAGGSVSRRDLIGFCFQLEQLARAGVALIEALADMRDSMESAPLRSILSSLQDSVEGGKTLSQALSEHPRAFDAVFTSLIRAGEDSGRLPAVLKSLTETLKWQDEIAAQTRKLIAYPAFMGVVIVAAVFFMMIYLVPRMTGFIANMGAELPLHTKMLIAASGFFVRWWPLILLAPVALALGVACALRWHPAARLGVDALKLKLPALGGIMRKILLARFAAVFAMMYAAGIPVLDAIHATESIVGNAVLQARLEQARQAITQGRNVAGAFQDAAFFPPLVIRMLRVGENTGALDAALENVAYFYDRDVKEAIGRLQALIEPTLTVAMGLILGWVMLSVLGPIYDVISKLKY